MEENNYKWMALNSTRMWTYAVITQGRRLLLSYKSIEDFGNHFDPGTNVKVLLDDRIIEEHFFVIAVSKAIDWIKETRKIFPEL